MRGYLLVGAQQTRNTRVIWRMALYDWPNIRGKTLEDGDSRRSGTMIVIAH